MNEFDKHIKDKISNHESPVSPDLWSKMEATRAVNSLEKGIQRGSSKLWTLLVIGLLLSSGVVFSYYNNLNSKLSTDEKIEKKSIIDNLEENEELAIDNKLLNSNSKNSSLNSAKANEESNSFTEILDSNDKSISNQRVSNENLNTKVNVFIIDTNQKSKKITSDFSGIQADEQEKIATRQVSPVLVTKTGEKEILKVENFLSIQSVWPLFSFEGKLPHTHKQDDIICGTYPKNYPFTYYLDFGFAPQRTVKYFTVKDGADKAYAQQRESTEGFHFGYSLSARFSMVHYTGFSFKTGLQYHQTNDFFEYKDSNYTEVVDTGIVTGLLDIAQYNRYKSFDVPIMIGYELDFNNFTFVLSTGVHTNVGFTKHGYILSPSGTVDEIQNNNQVYKNWVGLSWATNIGAYYHLNHRMQLMMEPHFRYSLTSLTSENYPLEQRNFSTGMRLGLRVRM